MGKDCKGPTKTNVCCSLSNARLALLQNTYSGFFGLLHDFNQGNNSIYQTDKKLRYWPPAMALCIMIFA